MVKVIGVETRKNTQGEAFTILKLQGDLEIVKSKETGKPYATVKRATMPSTFDEVTARGFIGSKLVGSIDKVPCEPYDYVVDGGDVIKLDFTYQYNPEPNSMEEVVMGDRILA